MNFDDLKAMWRRITAQCLGWAAAIQAAWAGLPEDMRASLTNYAAGISIALVILSAIGHFQSHKSEPEDPGKPDAP